ncbi:preprotein translocase subunit SecE [Candidatus Gracilibacteria bacterium]|nr:preprotein translocase subunit SecE [Candidatus Gracilibacteria bacterium]NJS40788.1 preprotein translocase subunit SecE [Candidatus Gracilibacteria bacterium]
MAVIKTKEDSLVEAKDLKNDNLNLAKEPKVEVDESKEKKKSFLATTIEELKKAEWPGIKYVLNWSLVIVLFTAIFAVSLGLIDNVFNSGLKFIDCTSVISDSNDANSSQVISDCSKDFIQDATYQS